MSSLSDLEPGFAVYKSSRKRETSQPADSLSAEAKSVEPETEHDFPSPALSLNSRTLLTVAFLLSKVSTSTAFPFSLSVVCTPSWQQLQHFGLLFAGAAIATVLLLTFWKLTKEIIRLKASFLYAFVLIENWSTVSDWPVTTPLQPVTIIQPLVARRPVSTHRKPIAICTINSCRLVWSVADKLQNLSQINRQS